MKFLLILSILLSLSLASIVTYGYTLNNENSIKETIVLEAPDVVVWNAISNFSDHHKWRKSIKALYNYNFSARQVRFIFGEKTIMANQQVRVRENANTIDFIQIGKEEYTQLKNIGGQISVKRFWGAKADKSVAPKLIIKYLNTKN